MRTAWYFYTLYGHLCKASVAAQRVGDLLKKGDRIGALGNPLQNGQWAPHLHFQIMLSMLDNTQDFPGVAFPKQMQVWKSICPDPNLLFKNPKLDTQYDAPSSEILDFRKKHLGKSLSISYQEPLNIVRGDGAYLIDTWGEKYLDTVNNVAHVGHEHPAVVKAAQEQIALLNTNTRYLNQNIIAYTKALLEKLTSRALSATFCKLWKRSYRTCTAYGQNPNWAKRHACHRGRIPRKYNRCYAGKLL